jgi:hypothetical protein
MEGSMCAVRAMGGEAMGADDCPPVAMTTMDKEFFE